MQNSLQHSTRTFKTANHLKNLENDPQKSMGYPSEPDIWRQHGCIWTLLLNYFVTFFEARWRVRSFAALWIRRARPCACAWRTESHTLIRRRSAERRARCGRPNFVLNPSCHPSSYFKLAYLPSSWQLDGLYTPSLILPLDLRLGAAAPSWCRLFASWAHPGRKNGLPRIFKK